MAINVGMVRLKTETVKAGQPVTVEAQISGSVKSVILRDEKAPASATGTWTISDQATMVQGGVGQAAGSFRWTVTLNAAHTGKHRVIVIVEATDGSIIDSSSRGMPMYQVNP